MQLTNQQGLSLLPVLLFLALLGILTKISIDSFYLQSRFEKYAEDKSTVIDLGRYLTNAFSCANTLSHLTGVCASGQFLSLWSQASTELVKVPQSNDYSKLGFRQVLQARCVACTGPVCINGKKILVETQQESSSLAPSLWTDVFSGKTLDCPLP